MIKFTMTRQDGKKIIGLGFHQGNLKHFKHGRPMLIDLDELNAKESDFIYIFSARTDKELAKEMKRFIGPDTVVNEL